MISGSPIADLSLWTLRADGDNATDAIAPDRFVDCSLDRPDRLSIVRLADRLHSPFDGAKREALAIRFGAGVQWDVDYDRIVVASDGMETSIALAGKTIGDIAHLCRVECYPVELVAHASEPAVLLVPGSGAGDVAVGLSQLWRMLHAQGRAFARAADAAKIAIHQVYLPCASAEFLDEHGAYYGVARAGPETDDRYRKRIITEILRPKANNRALAMILAAWFDTQSTRIDVIDVPIEDYTVGMYLHDGVWDYMDYIRRDGGPRSGHTQHYGQFDVVLDLVEHQPVSAEGIRDLVDHYKAAGTHMRSLSAMMRIVSPREQAVTGMLNLAAWERYFSSPGPRDGRYLRGSPGSSYLRDGAWGFRDRIPRDGTKHGGTWEIRYGRERDPVQLKEIRA